MKFEDLPRVDYDEAMKRGVVPVLTEYRRETPLLRLTSDNPEKNVLLVVDPDDVMAVMANGKVFSSTNHPQSRRFDSDYDAATAEIYRVAGFDLKNIAVWSDGAYHARVRKLIQNAFSAPQITAKTPYIQTIIDGLIDGVAGKGDIEFVEQYANRLTTMVITREFGLEAGDAALVREVTDKVSVMTDTFSPPQAQEHAAPAITRLQALLVRRLEQPASLPETSLLRQFAEARAEGEAALSRNELLWLATLLLAAAGHTTAAMLAWCLHVLAAEPGLQDQLRRQPEKIEAFVEETLRIHGPVLSSYRTVAEDTLIRGVSVPRGTWLVLRSDAVNFDEGRWKCPHQFDVDRAKVRQHFTFGTGEHFCIGNLLARRELVLTVESFLRRFSSIGFAGDPDRIQPIRSFDVHILPALPLSLKAART